MLSMANSRFHDRGRMPRRSPALKISLEET